MPSMLRSRRVAARGLAAAGFVLAAAVPAAALDPLGAVDPTADEQQAIYALNRARSDPAAYGRKIGVDLSGVVARPPLAVNRNLTGSARFHAKEMQSAGYFAHTSEVTGDGPNQMAVDNGYDLFGQGARDWGASNTIESIARGVKLIPKFGQALALLIEDKGVPGAGHRVHLLAIADQFAQHREVGMGGVHAGDEHVYAIHTANVSPSDVFLTGVVYDDRNRNGLYDAGEGLGGVTVSDGESSVDTLSTGGWSLPTGDGVHRLTCSGGAFRGQARARVTVDGANVAVDFRSGNPGAQVGFVQVDAPAVPGPDVSIDPYVTSGTAPLFVQFTATSSSEGPTALAWDLGDGSQSSSASPQVTYAPGAYAVFLDGTDIEGTGRAAAVVVAAGDEPVGTGGPADASLGVAKATLRANHASAGKDQVLVTLALELPAGFPGTDGLPLDVVAAGVRRTFTLDAKGRGADGAGVSARLTYKRPKGGAPTAAGVRAKLVLTWKGDFGDALDACGLRDAAEKRAIPNPVPFGVLLGGRAYAGGQAFRVVSKAGASSVATVVR